MKKPKYIIEVANTHGGNFEYIIALINKFSEYKEGFGIKFQPFKPDTIATNDYAYFDVYKELYFNNIQWSTIISKAFESKEIWLDIFDLYGIEVLSENTEKIVGIKFQSSVLYNYEVFNKLKTFDLSKKKIIINVAAQPIEDIQQIINYLEEGLKPEEILLEFGYQAYPTSLEDSGLCKLDIIKAKFNKRIVFADHVEGRSDDAIILPLVISTLGVDYIEKHVMLEEMETKYDHYSSLTPSRFEQMVSQINRYTSLNEKPFINDKEKVYLKNTMMIPILKKDIEAGSLINFNEDVIFRRSNKSGLTSKEIKELQNSFNIIAIDKKEGDTLSIDDFKKATIATIVACRLKSTRLPNKALLPIGGLPSVERCLKSCLEFKDVNHTILATSDLLDDDDLKNYTYNSSVVFHKGDPEDVIKRYLGIVEKLKIDIIIRVTADMPFVSSIIVEKLLKSHFSEGADYTISKNVAVGTGVEIINATSLKKIKNYFKSAKYSEYMTWYFQNNPEYFKLNFFDLPDELVRNYRLTLDYPEDLEMFNQLHDNLINSKLDLNILNIFSFLDTHPEINSINSHLTLRYKTDNVLIDTLNKYTKITSDMIKGQ
ncbi:MAG: N-acetylneuraminate synthase family protein [Bacteroidota bacterium]|nr:MAG: N-acetylneuraminate synthase family protein [Bacteroidota bacterium]